MRTRKGYVYIFSNLHVEIRIRLARLYVVRTIFAALSNHNDK